MKIYHDEKFQGFRDRESCALFENMEFHDCYFQGGYVSYTKDPKKRSTIRNIRMINCSQRGCAIYPAIIEDVLIDGFRTHGQCLQTWGAVFKHVILRGKVDDLMISYVVGIPSEEPEVLESFDTANAKYYENVDWALDISQAEFRDVDIRGLPARLIRRDPETQIVVTRETALEGRWRNINLKDGLWKTSLSMFLDQNRPDVVLVAPKKSRRFKNLLEDLRIFRSEGIAEPD